MSIFQLGKESKVNQEWPGLKASFFKIKIIGLRLLIFTVLGLILFFNPAFAFGSLRTGVSEKTAPNKVLVDRSESASQLKTRNYEIKNRDSC